MATDLREVCARQRGRIAGWIPGETSKYIRADVDDLWALLAAAYALIEWTEADAAEDALYAAGHGSRGSDELAAAIMRREHAEDAMRLAAKQGDEQ